MITLTYFEKRIYFFNESWVVCSLNSIYKKKILNVQNYFENYILYKKYKKFKIPTIIYHINSQN